MREYRPAGRSRKYLHHMREKLFELETRLQEYVIHAIRQRYGQNAWVFKVHDQCRVGVPDILLCFYGHFVAIELKRRKRVRKEDGKLIDISLKYATGTPLQKYNINLINVAGGTAFVGKDSTEIVERLDAIKKSLGYEI